MKKTFSAINIYLIYSGASALLFIMMKTVRGIYQVDIALLNPLQIVLIGTTLEITHFLFEIPTGVVADKYSRKLSIIIGLFLIGVSFIAEGLFPLFFMLIFIQIILGIGDTFTSGADEAWIADELNGKDLAPVFLKGTQIGQFFSIIGTIISMVLGGFIYIRLPYYISGGLFILLAIFFIFYMKETQFKKVVSSENHFKHMVNSVKLVLQLIKQKPVLILMVAITLFYGLYSEGFDRLWTPHILEEINLTPNKALLLTGFISLIAMLLSILAVVYIKWRLQKSGKLEKVWLLFVINLLMVFALFFFAITKEIVVTASLYIVFYTVRRINQPVYRAWMNEHITSSIRATVLSTYGQLDSIGQVISGPIIGAIALNTSISFGIVISSILLSPVIIIYLYFIMKVRKNELISY